MRLAEAPIRGRAPRTTLPIITQSELASIPFLKPPLEEQAEIAEFVAGVTGSIDRVASLLEAQSDKLAEYRQSLITASVTGAIDVAAQLSEPEAAIA